MVYHLLNNYASLKIDKNNLGDFEKRIRKSIKIDNITEDTINIEYKKRFEDEIEYADTYALENYGFCIAINERTKKIFENESNIEAQYFKLKSLDSKEELYMMSLLRKRDIIDYEKSEYSLIMNKYIGEIYKYVFKEEVKEEYIFKCFQDGVLDTIDKYCTDKFKYIVEKNNITGFKFEKIFEIE